ncbi:MAG TPA: GTPase HflX [Candidatus Thermoplasmatota archaeon]|nr:GTPase HflX [Candidatus Thermoplasmatota archaeon]
MRPRAVVVSTSDETAELEELLYSLGYDIAHKVVQKRGRPDPATYLGSGKVDELRSWLAEHGVAVPKPDTGAGEALQRAERRDRVDGAPAPEPVKLIAVNAHLKPSQVAALERLLGVDIYDRVRVILEIFRERAHTKEARLQVELARLRYERPLVREYIHLSKRGEHPGFMAGGAYAVDEYYSTINGRISRIQKELATIGREREVRRKHRRRGGFHLVSLAGYTNAGKSSLLHRLSGEDVLVENRMFSTLETRTGRAKAGGRDVLVTDTVGFIEGLPPELVKAFRSTLEEIAHADVIVLVGDASDALPEIARKLTTCFQVLRDVGDLAPLVLALNKADRVPPARRAEVEQAVLALGFVTPEQWVWTSALRGDGLDDLVAKALTHVPPIERVEAELPPGSAGEALLAAIYEDADVRSVDRREGLHVVFEALPAVAGSLRKRIAGAGGSATTVPTDLTVPVQPGTDPNPLSSTGT